MRLSEYRLGQKQFRFWLQWDRGTMNVRDLAAKFTSYAHYIASREWAREDSLLPALICVATDLTQERRIQHVAQATLKQCTGLKVRTTTEVLFLKHGPLSPVWIQVLLQRDQAAKPGSVLRQCMFPTNPAKKDM
jgi:hypothetical protein